MRRRELLVAGAVVAIAGCSSDETNDDPEEEDETEDLGNGPEDENDTEDQSNGNVTPDNESDGGDEPDDEPEGPTDQELAQEHIDAAQEALTSGVDELVDQGKLNVTFGEALNASIRLNSPELIEDHLSTVRSELQEAQQYTTTNNQSASLEAIEAAEAAIRALVDAQPTLNDLYQKELPDVLTDFEAERRSHAESGLDELRRTADDAERALTRVSDKTDAFAAEDADLVDAISAADLTTEYERLENDLSSVRMIADSVERLLSADTEFWLAYEQYQNGDYDGLMDRFESLQEDYEAAVSMVADTISTFSDATEYVECYGDAMGKASDEYYWAVNAQLISRASSTEYEENPEAALSDASECSFDR